MEKENRLKMETEILGEMMKEDERERRGKEGIGKKEIQGNRKQRRQGDRREGTRTEEDTAGLEGKWNKERGERR